MNMKLACKMAMTTLVVAVPMVGISQNGFASASKDERAAARAEKLRLKNANKSALQAQKLLAKGQTAEALNQAEAAVAGDMSNREYRALLARAYMANGRFSAAERTLMDVIELGQSDPRTVVSLALARIAQNKVDSAVALVEANRAILPASDYGLTLALAGQSKRAVEVLTDAIRNDNATSRTRQNLALALALDGRWRDAQVMAQQDMPETQADQRIIEWAQYARPGAYQTRVAGLLGVKAVEDAGQPVRLALNISTADSIRLAQAKAPPPQPISNPINEIELAAVGPAPVNVAGAGDGELSISEFKMPLPQPVVAAAPLIEAPSGPAKSAIAPIAAKPGKKPVKLALADTSVPAPAPAAATSGVSGTHLVQLGAFSSAANAQKAWAQYQSKYGALQGFRSASSTVTINGKKVIRLAAMGFANAQSANTVCKQIVAKGGACLVRSLSAGSSPVRLASASPVKKKKGKKRRQVRMAMR